MISLALLSPSDIDPVVQEVEVSAEKVNAAEGEAVLLKEQTDMLYQNIQVRSYKITTSNTNVTLCVRLRKRR
jgi:hypothetical protein